jgi:hypothetical protein
MPSRGPRRLELKFRVRPLVRMPVSVMFGKLQQFADSGVVPGDLEIAYMEYAHAKGQNFSPGQRLQPHEHEEFKKFYAVLTSVNEKEDVHVTPRSGKYKRNPALRLGEPD